MPLILVVDPDPDSGIILSALLRHAGYEVECVDSGVAGLDVARRLRPAAIIGEHPVRMTDGSALCDALRLDPMTRRIPFLALTSRVTAGELSDACRGHYRVFSKPPDFGAVIQAIGDAVEAHDR
jgi:CheY-like chemotaxis protein